MKQLVCEQCGQSRPMNETYRVFGRELCEECANRELQRYPEGAATAADVQSHVDPTVCRNCGADGGIRELARVAGLPVCDDCEQHFRYRPFPMWIKLSLAGLLAFACVAFIHNWRFFAGYLEMRRAGKALSEGDITTAAALTASAAERVPEAKELRDLADCFNGMELLRQDRCADAVPLLQRCARRFPAGSHWHQMANDFLLTAEAGVAFDNKDYDGFLAKSTEILRRQPNEEMAKAGVASAYACKYAATGDEAHKREAMRYLEQATQQSKDPGIAEYRQRILFRLHSREIIDKQEYDRRFPQGWNPETQK
jgi:hypothetical protein